MDKNQSQIIELSHPLEPVGPAGRIGLIALATDLNSEQDLRSMLPSGVELFTNRVANANPVTLENLRAMAPDIARAAKGILPEIRVDVLVYGCTSGTVAIGEEQIARLIGSARPGIPVTNPISATLAAFRALEVSTITVLTPYTLGVNEAMAGLFRDQGMNVLNIAGFGLESDEDMAAVPADAIVEAGARVCAPQADALFVSCTALRAAQAVAAMEEALGKPVITSNQAMLWHALRLIGNRSMVRGYGRLFDTQDLNDDR